MFLLNLSCSLCCYDDLSTNKSTLALSAVRRLFDQFIKQYPFMKSRLTATAVIDKLQRGEALHKTERPVWAEFRSPALEQTHAKGAEECSIVKAAFKIRNLVDVAYIRQTSNECERFSFVKSVWPGWPPRCVQMRYQGS
ncbi:hypothetical protein JG687_00018129 [Phytophthora cactorum]|uniref:Uncharacterized protein n=1 Tax=Phytophthora cactorum TaxID=29920 RepID=A0A8T1TMG4_9STRA|nr:hypothetical protein JG687_00018129 [Phytophthora cactorum]